MKKLMAVLLVTLMVISTLPIIASATEANKETEPDVFSVNATSNLFTPDQATSLLTLTTTALSQFATLPAYRDSLPK